MHLDIIEGTEIELKTITGFSSKGTMKMKGMVKWKELVEDREILVFLPSIIEPLRV